MNKIWPYGDYLMIYYNNPKSSTVSKTAINMSEKIELFSIPLNRKHILITSQYKVKKC